MYPRLCVVPRTINHHFYVSYFIQSSSAIHRRKKDHYVAKTIFTQRTIGKTRFQLKETYELPSEIPLLPIEFNSPVTSTVYRCCCEKNIREQPSRGLCSSLKNLTRYFSVIRVLSIEFNSPGCARLFASLGCNYM